MAASWSTIVTDWQCEDAIDVAGSEKDEVSIVDKNDYAILRLLSYLLIDKNGNIRTKGFNSAEQAIIGNALAVLSEKFANTFPGGTSSDFSVEDENGYAILKLLSYLQVNEDGAISTKSFDSSKLKIASGHQDTLSFEDLFGNSILKINGKGHIKTKSFDSSKFIIVDINGGGDYTSLEDAIDNAGDTYGVKDATIIVMPGTYNMTKIADDTNRNTFSNRSLNIIGVSREKCIVVGSNGYYDNVGTPGVTMSRDSAPLKLTGNCYIANLTIISNDDNFQMPADDSGNPDNRHHAYCIHVDYGCSGDWTFHVDNCILKNDHYACIGCGVRGKLIVTNCVMECEMYDPNELMIRGCVYAHDNPLISETSEVLVKDCILTGHSGYPLTFFYVFNKPVNLTFINNVAFNDGYTVEFAESANEPSGIEIQGVLNVSETGSYNINRLMSGYSGADSDTIKEAIDSLDLGEKVVYKHHAVVDSEDVYYSWVVKKCNFYVKYIYGLTEDIPYITNTIQTKLPICQTLPYITEDLTNGYTGSDKASIEAAINALEMGESISFKCHFQDEYLGYLIVKTRTLCKDIRTQKNTRYCFGNNRGELNYNV